MKKLVLFTLLALVAVAGYANAADQILDTTVKSAITAIDSRGGEYVRLIVDEERNLQGMSYVVGVPVMAFSSNPSVLEQAKELKAGDSLKAIVSGREYQGRKSYTIIQFVK